MHLAVMEGAGSFTRHVAMKRLHKETTRNPRFVSLLVREARLGGLMNHDNVVATIDLIKVGDEYILVSDYVDGVDLSVLIHRARALGDPLGPSFVAEVGYQICQGLAYIHGLCDLQGGPLGLVHRDLKPSNVLIHRSGSVKLADFGVARSAVLDAETTKESVMGTPRYMAPEQALGRPAGPETDLYALGVLLCEALYLKVPKRSLRIAKLAGSRPEDVASAPEELLGRYPGGPFTPLLLSLLQPDPARRPRSAREVGERIDLIRRAFPPPRSFPLVVEDLLDMLVEESDAELDDSLVVEFASDDEHRDEYGHGARRAPPPSGPTLLAQEPVEHLMREDTGEAAPRARRWAPLVLLGAAALALVGFSSWALWLLGSAQDPVQPRVLEPIASAPDPEPALGPVSEPEPVLDLEPEPDRDPVLDRVPEPVPVRRVPTPAPPPLALRVTAPDRALRNTALAVAVDTGTAGCSVTVHWRVEGRDWAAAPLAGIGPAYTWTLDVTAAHRPALEAWVAVSQCGEESWRGPLDPHRVRVW